MKAKILLIDDDVLVLKSTKNLLVSRNYDVVCAKKFEEVSACIDVSHFDLIISDVRMPGRDGVSTVKFVQKRLKEMGKKNTPFIFITGYASEDVPIDAVKLGASDYILKPFDNDQLLLAIENSLKEGARLNSESGIFSNNICDNLENLRNVIQNYVDHHEQEILNNKELHSLFTLIENMLDQLEKKFIKNESIR